MSTPYFRKCHDKVAMHGVERALRSLEVMRDIMHSKRKSLFLKERCPLLIVRVILTELPLVRKGRSACLKNVSTGRDHFGHCVTIERLASQSAQFFSRSIHAPMVLGNIGHASSRDSSN
jgi:hypothetical protein